MPMIQKSSYLPKELELNSMVLKAEISEILSTYIWVTPKISQGMWFECVKEWFISHLMNSFLICKYLRK